MCSHDHAQRTLFHLRSALRPLRTGEQGRTRLPTTFHTGPIRLFFHPPTTTVYHTETDNPSEIIGGSGKSSRGQDHTGFEGIEIFDDDSGSAGESTVCSRHIDTAGEEISQSRETFDAIWLVDIDGHRCDASDDTRRETIDRSTDA